MSFDLNGNDEFSARAVEIDCERSILLQRLDRLVGRLNGVRAGTRYEFIIERHNSSGGSAVWSWRHPLPNLPKPEDIRLVVDAKESILIALPNMEHTRSDQYDIFRLDPSSGRERPVPGGLIRAARAPAGVRLVTIMSTPSGRTIGAGTSEDPLGTGWWIGGW